jgi:integrase
MKKPKYVREYKDRHGVTRLEFRRKGHRGFALRQPLRTPEFWDDYNAALTGSVPPGVLLKYGERPAPITAPKQKSLRWLIIEYRNSAKYKRGAESTRDVRGRILDRMCLNYGDWPYAGLNRQAVLKLRDKRADKPEAANAIVKALRQVYKYALEYDVEGVDADPTRDVEYLSSGNPDGFHAWTMEELEQFEERHPVGTKARLALTLSLYGGCARRSDLVALGRQHVTKDGRLKYTQYKGRTKAPVTIDIDIISELRRIIDASPTGDLTFLVTEFNKPFTKNGFGNWMRKRCDEAGLPQCSTHGIRKIGAARLAELGCSDHEIMAIGGWTTLKEVQRYTKGARRKILADNATSKVQADIERTKVSNLSGNGKKVRQ